MKNKNENLAFGEVRATLAHCKAALKYAFEDSGDQYYMNVSEHVTKAFSALEALQIIATSRDAANQAGAKDE